MPKKKNFDRVVIKLTGSLFKRYNKSTVIPFINLFNKMHESNTQLFVVTGGGEAARQYITLARNLGAEETSLDEIGIMASRINAKILIAGLGESAHPVIPANLEDFAHVQGLGRIIVTGGMMPGQSTNAVASLIAEKVRARIFVNASDVDGVYTSDPKSNKTARKLAEVNVAQFSKIISSMNKSAGTYELMDQIALNIIARSRIPTRIVQCLPELIRKAVEEQAVGTLVTPNN